MTADTTGQPIRITSDGTPTGTTVWCGDTRVTNCTRADWSAEGIDQPCTAVLHLELVPADLAAPEGRTFPSSQVMGWPLPGLVIPDPEPPWTRLDTQIALVLSAIALAIIVAVVLL